MPVIQAKDLLQAGAQFGHSTSHWNPKMAPYILGKKNKIHIINLRETVKGLVAACYFAKKLIAQGQQILFVGTKRQAQEIIETQGRRCEMPYVRERWLGGTLTNLETIQSRVQRLLDLEKDHESGEVNKYSKKMQSSLRRELRKVKRNLDGIRNMKQLPGALFVVDPKHDHTAVREARRLSVPIIAVLDTDANPDDVQLPIPANDDALRSIDLIVSKFADAVIEGHSYRKEHPEVARRVQEEAHQRQMAATSQSVGSYTAGARGR